MAVRINQFHSVKFYIFFIAFKIKFLAGRLYMHERQLTERRLVKILNASLRMLKNSSSNLCFHRVRIKNRPGFLPWPSFFKVVDEHLQTLAAIQLQRFKLIPLMRKIIEHFRQCVFHFIKRFGTIMKYDN